MSHLREIAYRVDPVLWVREVLGVTPTAWQETFLRAPRGASILALTARQVGKTTTAAWAIAHAMIFTPGSLSVIACPAQRQSAEAVRRVREVFSRPAPNLRATMSTGSNWKTAPGCWRFPAAMISIRGLTVDAWIVADEAARLPDDLIAALRPMRARRPQARFAMLSTAWSRTDPFWTAWASDDPTWIRLKATADTDPELFRYGIPGARTARARRAWFQARISRHSRSAPRLVRSRWDLYERATQIHVPLVPPGPAFGPPLGAAGGAIANPFHGLKQSERLP